MEIYIANLLREKSATSLEVVTDDATSFGVLEKKKESRDSNEPSDRYEEDKWQQPVHAAPIIPFRRGSNEETIHTAPTIPSRRESVDALPALPTLEKEKFDFRFGERTPSSSLDMPYRRVSDEIS